MDADEVWAVDSQRWLNAKRLPPPSSPPPPPPPTPAPTPSPKRTTPRPPTLGALPTLPRGSVWLGHRSSESAAALRRGMIRAAQLALRGPGPRVVAARIRVVRRGDDRVRGRTRARPHMLIQLSATVELSDGTRVAMPFPVSFRCVGRGHNAREEMADTAAFYLLELANRADAGRYEFYGSEGAMLAFRQAFHF